MAGVGAFVRAEMRKCRHFTGIQHETCAAGVCYRDVRDESVSPFRFPCTNPIVADLCDKRSPYAREEAEAELERFERRIEDTSLAHAAILGATQGEVGISGEVACPVCQAGALRYSVASVNGHIHAQCSTDDCVRWME